MPHTRQRHYLLACNAAVLAIPLGHVKGFVVAMSALFTYGTLVFPEVMAAVTGQIFSSTAAMASDFRCYRLKHQIYPGMIGEPGVSTIGSLYLDVTERAMRFLDEFEDAVYVKEPIHVSLSTNEMVEALAYVIPETNRDVLSRHPWNKAEFLVKHLSRYVQSCGTFHAELALMMM